MSVSCRGVRCPNMVTIEPIGMIEKDTNAMAPAMTGASRKTALSAFLGIRSSLNASFMPSARVCSRPKGPVRLGPGRCCIRPMTRRSNQMTSRVLTIRKTKTSSALISDSHHGVSLKSATGLSVLAASAGAITWTPP